MTDLQVRRERHTAKDSPALAISNEMVGLLARYTGRGPTKARTTLDSNIVVVTLQDMLTKGEQNLVAAGQLDTVNEMRRSFHRMMRDEASTAVAEILDRDVVACLSDVDPRANVAVMVFVLEPNGHGGRLESAEARRNGA